MGHGRNEVIYDFFEEFSVIIFSDCSLRLVRGTDPEDSDPSDHFQKFVAERLVGSGGMPSSHSATVCALVTATCYEYGAGSFEFAISLILAIIVMYDAMGVRRETGIQAQVLNDMMKIFEDMGRSEISPHDKLKEFVGHTPLQVLMGALLGIFCGVIIYTFVI